MTVCVRTTHEKNTMVFSLTSEVSCGYELLVI